MPAYRIDFRSPLQITSLVVIGDTPAQAIRFVAGGIMTCTTLSGEAVANAVADGLKVKDARQPQKELELTPGPVAGASSVKFILPGGSEAKEMFLHKEGCTADPWTPIAGKGCRCTKLDIPLER